MKQNTSHLLMIRPVRFGFNAETAINNAFQLQGYDNNAQEKALVEFDNFVAKLRLYGLNINVLQDIPDPYTPDSIFPNNWISFHNNNSICLYPMFAKNRRSERKPHIVETIKNKFIVDNIIDLVYYEENGLFLEGTGSMVLDRENEIAYACLSPRTNDKVLSDFCNKLNYKQITFKALDSNNSEIYHTNVMMSVADKYAIICGDSIKNAGERQLVMDSLVNSGKEIIILTIEQMNNFAGNALQVQNDKGEQFLIMSSTALRSLTQEQLGRIRHYNEIIDSELDTIEKNGGGSARCMLAEIFLEVK